jgi:hypothetical protein
MARDSLSLFGPFSFFSNPLVYLSFLAWLSLPRLVQTSQPEFWNI